MGIVPLQYLPDQNAESLSLSGKEMYTIDLPVDIKPGQNVTVKVLHPILVVSVVRAPPYRVLLLYVQNYAFIIHVFSAPFYLICMLLIRNLTLSKH